MVSLAVLGLIAGLTIPSIVASVERSKNRTLLKETVQLISEITQNGVLNGDFANISWDYGWDAAVGIVPYISSKLNYSKQCLINVNTATCPLITSPNYATYGNNSARWILRNGVKVQSLGNYWNSAFMWWVVTTKPYSTTVTLSGNNPDALEISCNITDTTQVANGKTIKAGMCGPVSDGWGAQFNSIMFN